MSSVLSKCTNIFHGLVGSWHAQKKHLKVWKATSEDVKTWRTYFVGNFDDTDDLARSPPWKWSVLLLSLYCWQIRRRAELAIFLARWQHFRVLRERSGLFCWEAYPYATYTHYSMLWYTKSGSQKCDLPTSIVSYLSLICLFLFPKNWLNQGLVEPLTQEIANNMSHNKSPHTR